MGKITGKATKNHIIPSGSQEVDMSGTKLTVAVRRVSPFANVIDISGEINSFSDNALSEAFSQVTDEHVRTIILNFTDLAYINSFGLGMLITLLIRARREGKNVVGYGLKDHYRRIFEITRIDQVIPIHSSEEIALALGEPMDLPEREN
jgi:anti-sigma B factor antagonist